jgi:hypothetical protein
MSEIEKAEPVEIIPAKSERAQHLEKYQKRFQPGQSGNPGGRPRNLLSQVARETLPEINPTTGLSHAQEIVNGQIKKAKAGDTWAARLLQEWSEGKVRFAITAEISGDSEGALSSAKQKLLQRLVGFRELPDANQGEHSETQRS